MSETLHADNYKIARQLLEALEDMRWFEPALTKDGDDGLVLRLGQRNEDDNSLETSGGYVILDRLTARMFCSTLHSLIQERLAQIGVRTRGPFDRSSPPPSRSVK